MHLRSGPVSLLLLLLPPLHHIKVPLASNVSQVEEILSDKMSREPWSRDHRWSRGASGNGTGSTSAGGPLEYRSLSIRRFNGTSSSYGPSIFPPFPLSIDRTSTSLYTRDLNLFVVSCGLRSSLPPPSAVCFSSAVLLSFSPALLLGACVLSFSISGPLGATPQLLERCDGS